MNFDVLSDLHLNNITVLGNNVFNAKSPVLVLLGDICHFQNFEKYSKFFERANNTWDYVLYVLGNHEFYGSYLYHDTVMKIKGYLKEFTNIYVLDNEVIDIDSVRFIGSTLWSNMNNNPVVELICFKNFPDYRFILKTKNKYITTEDIVSLFKRNIAFIKDEVKKEFGKKIVILTHHAPSFMSISPIYTDSSISGAFASDLDDFILKNRNIRAWCHGHTHYSVNYMIGSCNIVSNPLGYNNELYFNSIGYEPALVNIS
jgi:hypothetical protein